MRTGCGLVYPCAQSTRKTETCKHMKVNTGAVLSANILVLFLLLLVLLNGTFIEQNRCMDVMENPPKCNMEANLD